MKFSKWHIAPAEEADIRRLGEAGYPQLVSQVLAARGISTAEEAAAFWRDHPELEVELILVLEDGKIAERGTDAALMATDTKYREYQTLYEQANEWRVVR